LALTEKAKSKPIYQKAQKAMQYSFTLREEDVRSSLFVFPTSTLYHALQRP
jgi:THO complex subunit 1